MTTDHTRRDLLRWAALAGAAAALTPVAGGSASAAPTPAGNPWARAEYIGGKVRRPHFPERRLDLERFGAVGDGVTDCTAAFRRAIEECHAAGGGHVVVPAGRFLTGPIHLLSNVDLHVAADAVVLFSQTPADYLPAVLTRFEGVELYNYSPLIYAYGQENIGVTGAGVLDGQADNVHWWPWKGKTEYGWKPGDPRQDEARARLFAMAEQGVPVEQRVFGEGDYLRSSFIEPYRCRNVLIEGVTIVRSPMWEIHPTCRRTSWCRASPSTRTAQGQQTPSRQLGQYQPADQVRARLIAATHSRGRSRRACPAGSSRPGRRRGPWVSGRPRGLPGRSGPARCCVCCG
ncbi:glycoside hydrolase family 28 protein [Micromonospora coerulea]|uniref:glycoside hydrolase family 28 protein n=1 Tax=Micromonospora coerulea TaxID=47856 RepID=UPI0027DDCB39|nr:glycosyl hydrolase family 28-related protein [Micromonospora veneta]